MPNFHVHSSLKLHRQLHAFCASLVAAFLLAAINTRLAQWASEALCAHERRLDRNWRLQVGQAVLMTVEACAALLTSVYVAVTSHRCSVVAA